MIPATAHFVWLGPSFPWIYGLAVRSAAQRGEFDRVVLHHSDDLSATPGWGIASGTPKVECRYLEPVNLLRFPGGLGNSLMKLYDRLETPAARVNMLRVALLAGEGGVYLDTDTLTVRPIIPLLNTGVFCGSEYIAVPGHVAQSNNPLVRLKALWQRAIRDVYRRWPNGWRNFRSIESSYHCTVNNAILGASPGHPILLQLLKCMASLPRKQQLVRYALGTHLLQQVVADYHGDDLTVHPPHLFFPFPPEISEHWFRPTRTVCLDEALTSETRIVHWYASVRTKPFVSIIDQEYVQEHANNQLFSALALQILQGGQSREDH